MSDMKSRSLARLPLGVHAIWLPLTVWLIVAFAGIGLYLGVRHAVRFHADSSAVTR